jgi:hypothetical protein
MPYKFVKTPNVGSKYDIAGIEMTIPDDVTISQILEEFGAFLLGCGFVFDGKIELVEEEAE